MGVPEKLDVLMNQDKTLITIENDDETHDIYIISFRKDTKTILTAKEFEDQLAISWPTFTELPNFMDYVWSDEHVNHDTLSSVSPTHDESGRPLGELVDQEDFLTSDFFSYEVANQQDDYYALNWIEDYYPESDCSNRITYITNYQSQQELMQYIITDLLHDSLSYEEFREIKHSVSDFILDENREGYEQKVL